MQPLVIRFGRMGDMVLQAPLLGLLRRGYGEPCTLLGTGPWTAELYAAHRDVRDVVEVHNRHAPLALSPAFWRMTAVLRHRSRAAIYVSEPEPHPLAKIRAMLAIARVPPERCTFLADRPVRSGQHWVDRLLQFGGTPPAGCAGAWHPPDEPRAAAPRLCVADQDRRGCDRWLRSRGWRGEPIWLVQPSSHVSASRHTLRDPSRDHKLWPAACWVEALRALRADHPQACILLVGAPDEAAMLDDLASRARDNRTLAAVRGVPLRRLMALAEIAEGMLSVDTGPAHIAAAMGCPLVVLFGAASPGVWCPRSPTGSAVKALGGAPGRSRVAQITADEVIAALHELPPRLPGLWRAA